MSKRDNNRLLRIIMPQITNEAFYFLGLAAQLHQKAQQDYDEKVTDYLEFDEWIEQKTCHEIALNEISKQIGFEDIPTHYNNLEEHLRQTPEGKKLGRDNLVKAIWRKMKEILEAKPLEEIPVVKDPSFTSDWDSEYNIRCPFCNERVFEREKEYFESHRDGTDNWSWKYIPENCCDHQIGSEYSSSGDIGFLDDLYLEPFIDKLKFSSQYDLLSNVDGIEVEICDEGREWSHYYFVRDDVHHYDEIYNFLVNLLRKKYGRFFPFQLKDVNDYQPINNIAYFIEAAYIPSSKIARIKYFRKIKKYLEKTKDYELYNYNK